MSNSINEIIEKLIILSFDGKYIEIGVRSVNLIVFW